MSDFNYYCSTTGMQDSWDSDINDPKVSKVAFSIAERYGSEAISEIASFVGLNVSHTLRDYMAKAAATLEDKLMRDPELISKVIPTSAVEYILGKMMTVFEQMVSNVSGKPSDEARKKYFTQNMRNLIMREMAPAFERYGIFANETPFGVKLGPLKPGQVENDGKETKPNCEIKEDRQDEHSEDGNRVPAF